MTVSSYCNWVLGITLLSVHFTSFCLEAEASCGLPPGQTFCDFAPGQTSTIATNFVYPIGEQTAKPITGTFNPNGYRVSRTYQGLHERTRGRHVGADLFTEGGSVDDDVRAIAAGQIVYCQEVETADTMGHMVRIEHRLPDGQFIYSQYAHLEQDSIDVTCGDEVSVADSIGQVGKTGTAKEHLHFEVKTINTRGCGYLPSTRCTVPDSFSNYRPPLRFIEARRGEFDFALALLTVDGNILNSGEPNGVADFSDGFGDGSTTAFPTSAFFFPLPTTEAGDYLRLRSSEGTIRVIDEVTDLAFLAHSVNLGGTTTSPFLLQDGAGDSVITATFRGDIPQTGQAYTLFLVTLGGEQSLSINVVGGESGPVVTGFIFPERVGTSVPVNFIGVAQIHLRLTLDDATNRVTPSFSFNGRQFTNISLPPLQTVFSTSDRAFVQALGSIIDDGSSQLLFSSSFLAEPERAAASDMQMIPLPTSTPVLPQ